MKYIALSILTVALSATSAQAQSSPVYKKNGDLAKVCKQDRPSKRRRCMRSNGVTTQEITNKDGSVVKKTTGPSGVVVITVIEPPEQSFIFEVEEEDRSAERGKTNRKVVSTTK